jgi:hypothetical protein
MPGKRWTSDDNSLGRLLLEESRDLGAVADQLGRSRTSVRLRNNRYWKIRVPHTGGSNLVPNEAFVESWSASLSYVVGFLTADGNVRKNGTGFSVSQSHESGRDHLRSVLPLVGGSVRGPYKDDVYTLNVCSPRMATWLTQVGVVPAKSLKMVDLPLVPESLMQHFMLGLFDGDGSVYHSNGSRPGRKPMVGLSIAGASPKFLESVKSRLSAELNTRGSVVTNQVIWPHHDSVTILEWMFEIRDQVPHLPRKYETYRRLIDARQAWGDRSHRTGLISAIKKELPAWQ